MKRGRDGWRGRDADRDRDRALQHFYDGATAQYEKTLCSLKHSELSQKPHCSHPGLYMPSVSGFAEVMEEEGTSMGNSLKVNERNPTYV